MLQSIFVVAERLSVFTPADYSRLQAEKWPRQDGCRRGTQDGLAEEEELEVRPDTDNEDGTVEIVITEDRESHLNMKAVARSASGTEGGNETLGERTLEDQHVQG